VTSRNFQTGVNGSFRVLFGTGFHQMKVVCFSQGTVAVDKFVIVLCDVSSEFSVPKITKVGQQSEVLSQGNV